MGYYINPKTGDKTGWLNQKGRPVTRTTLVGFDFTDKQIVPVVEVDNGPFTAAGVCYNSREIQDFTDPTDHRPIGLPSLLQRLGVS